MTIPEFSEKITPFFVDALRGKKVCNEGISKVVSIKGDSSPPTPDFLHTKRSTMATFTRVALARPTTHTFQRRTAWSKSGSGSGPTVVTGPTEKLKSWQSGARLVKNTKVESQYLDHIRDMHDPSLHLKTIEDELKGTIGKALGKQGEKVLRFMRMMEHERQQYTQLLESEGTPSQLQAVAQKYNQHREQCIHARWELIVHRQAVGFTVGNHKFVLEKFPIADALPVDSERNDGSVSSETPHEKKRFGDQLDWWQRIGRWR